MDSKPKNLKKMTKDDKIFYLSQDRMFGILTRPALELALSEQKGIGTIFFLDISRLHQLNKVHGYIQVNERLKRIFIQIKDKYSDLIIGRIFSGDEIAIVDLTRYRSLINYINSVFQSEKIEFRYFKSKIELGQSPVYYQIVLDMYINTLIYRKNILVEK